MKPLNETPEDVRRAFSPATQLTELENFSYAVLSKAGLPSTWDALMAYEDTLTDDSGHRGPIMYRLRDDPSTPAVAKFAMTIVDRCNDVRIAMRAGDAPIAVTRMFDVIALLAGAINHEDARVQKYAAQTLGALERFNKQRSAGKDENIDRTAALWNTIRATNPRWRDNAIADAVSKTPGIDVSNKTVTRYAKEHPDLFKSPTTD